MDHRVYLEAEREAQWGATEGYLAAVDGELRSALREPQRDRASRRQP